MDRQAALTTDFYVRPGRFLEGPRIDSLTSELMGLDASTGRRLGDVRALLDGRVLALARRPDGVVVACCSATPRSDVRRPLLEVDATVVVPGEDREALAEDLEDDLLTTFLARQHPLGRVWVKRAGSDERPRALSLASLMARRWMRRLGRPATGWSGAGLSLAH